MGKKKKQSRPAPSPVYIGMPPPAEFAKTLLAEMEKGSLFPPGTTVTDVSAYLNAGSTPVPLGSIESATLPRDTGAFDMLPFWPGQPLLPAPIGPVRDDGSRRPGIRRYEYPVGWNLFYSGQPAIPFQTLRDAADVVDLVRRCIELRKSEMTRLNWDITFHDRALEAAADDIAAGGATSNPTATTAQMDLERQMQAKQSLVAKYRGDIAKARAFWETPDRLNNLSFSEWLVTFLEEYFVIDAATVYPHMALNGDLHSIEVIDGSTIKPLLDTRGATPQPPAPAYQQILYGFPRGEWLMSPPDAADGAYSADELIYRPRHRRAFTPYGHSPVEKSLVSAGLWLNRQEWLRTEYSDSSIPTMFIKVPDTVTWTPEQLRQYELIVNETLSGQTAERLKLRFLPPGLDPHEMNRFTDMYKPEFDLFLVRLVCSHFDVMPSELGFTPSKGLGGKGHSEGEENSEYRHGILPLARWLEDVFSDISHRYLGTPKDLVFKFSGLETEDEKLQAEIDQILLSTGINTVDEIRARRGLPLYGQQLTNSPILVAQTINVLTDAAQAEQKEQADQKRQDAKDVAEARASQPPPVPGQPQPPMAGRPAAANQPPRSPAEKAARGELEAFKRFLGRPPDLEHRAFRWDHIDLALGAGLETLARTQGVPAARSAVDRLLKHGGVEGGDVTDHANSIPHLADSVAFNIAHGRRHMDEAFEKTEKLLDRVVDDAQFAGEYQALQAAKPTAIKESVGKASARGSRARGTAKTTKLHAYGVTLTNHYAPLIARALRGSHNPRRIVAALRARGLVKQTHDEHDLQAAIRAILGTSTTDPAVLEELYRDAWLAGMMGGRQAAGLPGDYWDTWQPGSFDAAAAVLGMDPIFPGAGLQTLLANSGVVIRSIDQTLQDRLGQLIADSLAKGDPPKVLERAIDDELGGRADLIARTETNRAQTGAALDTYAEMGITGKQFLTAEDDLVDEDCQANEDQGAIPIDDEFDNGDPPVHPACRCVLIPAEEDFPARPPEEG